MVYYLGISEICLNRKLVRILFMHFVLDSCRNYYTIERMPLCAAQLHAPRKVYTYNVTGTDSFICQLQRRSEAV